MHANGSLATGKNSIEELNMPYMESFVAIKGSRGNEGNGCMISGDCIKSLNLPNLKYCCGLNSGTTMGQLINGRNVSPIEEINLPELYCTGCGHPEEGWYTINRCPNLKRIIMPNVKYCGKNIIDKDLLIIQGDSKYSGFVLNCPNLDYIYIPKCTSMVYGNFISGSNPTKIVFGTLTEFYTNNGYNGYTNMGNKIIHFEICADGGKLKNSLSFIRWVPSALPLFESSLVEDTDICSNNLEQFLYNFRTYIIDRVFNYSSGSKHTITLHSIVYNIVLGLDETSYASTFHMPNEDIDYVTSLNQKLSSINWGLAYA